MTDKNEEKFEDILRQKLNEIQFNKYVLENISIEWFCDKQIEWFINLSDEEQKKALKEIKGYLL